MASMSFMFAFSHISFLFALVGALRFSEEHAGFNLNENRTALDPLAYWGTWPAHDYHPSPKNWRLPTYTLFLDRFVNGNPRNDNANETQFEHDILSNQLRHGGDVQGLRDTLDYLQGMGIRTVYLAGSPFINMPWASDGYSPLDLTLLDRHFGNIDAWRNTISDIHDRGMFVILDNTFATLGDLIGFKDHLNGSALFSPQEYDVVYKSDRVYQDFSVGNTEKVHCEYPRLWDADGHLLKDLSSSFVGCRDSEFDQYGDEETPGNIQPYELQLIKFASVQDRLREWRADVLAKIQHFSCLTISMLDIDGYRIDKATQVTLDSQGAWSSYIRQCAKTLNKKNFFITGEISTSNTFGSLYIGRGMEPEMAVENLTEAVSTTNATGRAYIRASGESALDGAAFHYTVYRTLKRFLGIESNFQGEDTVDFVEIWNTLLQTNDMVNANTGLFDPRHMFGVTNQDVFRWPAIQDGIQRQLLGLFIVNLLLPGIPTLYWGEEQAMYILENLNSNYLFGRQPMSSSLAWQLHGCYSTGSTENLPIDAALKGCTDDNVSLDHRDPSHPVRNIVKRMFELRESYPVLQDGYYLQHLDNKTRKVFLGDQESTPTDVGLWSIYRSAWSGVQIAEEEFGNQDVWLLYANENQSVKYEFDCSGDNGLVAPFMANTTLKNLFAPYEEYVLSESKMSIGLQGPLTTNGCVSRLDMPAWGFKALVPKAAFAPSTLTLTEFSPGHDARILSFNDTGETVHIKLGFSKPMDCVTVLQSIQVGSTTAANITASVEASSIHCTPMDMVSAGLVGMVSTAAIVELDLVNVHHGVHRVTVSNATAADGSTTGVVDHLLIRVGDHTNSVVFPRTANYSTTILHQSGDNLEATHTAAGADLWRYSLDFGTCFSDWLPYTTNTTTLAPRTWSGTNAQSWKGQHVVIQYWSRLAGSSDHFVHGDVVGPPRRFPNLFLEGDFNAFGSDTGLSNKMSLSADSIWSFDFAAEWPTTVSLNVWGLNPDGELDQTQIYGDVDGDHVLDRVPPQSLLQNAINMTTPPPSPYLGYRLEVNDGNLSYRLVGTGSRTIQIIVYALLWCLPIAMAVVAVWAYMGAFYKIKFNQFGASSSIPFLSTAFGRTKRSSPRSSHLPFSSKNRSSKYVLIEKPSRIDSSNPSRDPSPSMLTTGLNTETAWGGIAPSLSIRKKVLIATIEYDIEDWDIKVKIGGLGVMAQLMGKSLGHQDLIWVVPCVGGVDYPESPNEAAEPMEVKVLDKVYQVNVRTHVLRNITYIILDAPVFRQQTKAEPYPPRMDDVDSAVYYSAWNQCIAEAIRRYKPDLYHINDYHGAVAPLYLLPETMPCALSLHNAEFQGLWPMRSTEETTEVCRLYNLDLEVVKKYVKFGEVFNLLHAGASYLRVHQEGFGAIGVSRKYGKRSYARYPIFWGLKSIGSLPNPDPSDIADWSSEKESEASPDVAVDRKYEAERADFRTQAQKWANLNVDPTAELFVFVGRWSNQKGVDLIADIFPTILERHPTAQLICVGPVIDLYGKFASLKLARLMEIYPGRVFSKPEFTALPPYIFSGAEFALIPSRDEPFGLVAVEFGRKGALGVGARVGGLGQMPGWWYTVESTSTKHLLHQFQKAIDEAIACPNDVRAQLRARSAKQRFPVAQWRQDLEKLQSMAIQKHHKRRSSSCSRSTAFPVMITRPTSTKSRSPSLASTRSVSPEGRQSSSGPSTDYHISAPVSREGSYKYYTGNLSTRYEPYRGIASSFSDASDAEEQPDINPRGRSVSRMPMLQPAEVSVIPPTPLSPSLRKSWGGAAFAPEVIDENENDKNYLLPLPFRNRSPSPSNSFYRGNNTSTLSLDSVRDRPESFELQSVNASFKDSTGEYTQAYQVLLGDLNSSNSPATCVEEYIVRSEKDWFERYRQKKMGSRGIPQSSVFRYRDSSPGSVIHDQHDHDDDESQFLLDQSFKPPKGLAKIMLYSVGDWPVYSFLLALGQIIAANSYQITLLTGDSSEAELKIFIISGIYLVTSVMWWCVFRKLPSVYLLSVPFAFYGLAFCLITLSSLGSNTQFKNWTVNVATGMYALASSSGSFFFALNFGDQGGVPVKTWIFRACIIQGTQQIYAAALWLWGSILARQTQRGIISPSTEFFTKNVFLLPSGLSMAVLLWAIGLALFFGLPKYYRQAPGSIPSFIPSVLRRKIVLWFFATVAIQTALLSPFYARTWAYLFSSRHLQLYQIVLLIILFFILLWAAALFFLQHHSKTHPWLLPIFAIGLGVPRWCQVLWAVSGIAVYIPWAAAAAASSGTTSSAVGSAIAGRTLWLWLGTLDALQGVGFGMILLQTLARFHICFALVGGQVIGAAATILGRLLFASSPERVGLVGVMELMFPNFGLLGVQGLKSAWFWCPLVLQLVVVNGGALKFFRKEQLAKP